MKCPNCKADTTRVSSRGQVVIPERLRKKLGIKTGDLLVVTELQCGETGANGLSFMPITEEE